MGLSPFRSWQEERDSGISPRPIVNVYPQVNIPTRKTLPNPDPCNFKIIRGQQVDKHLVVEVHYPDCTNFEGNKILLYKDTKLREIKGLAALDPHFNKQSSLNLVARFVPTKEGWNLAIQTATFME